MEIKATLQKPYTDTERIDFIVSNNHNLGYVIEETDTELQAWDKTEEEKQQEESERLNGLNLTKADFWIALLDRDITKEMVKEKINLIPDEKLKAKTLIRLDDADHFWRGDPSMNVIGAMFDITPQDLNYLFENGELPKE
jgi:hypothetical protein